MKTPHTASKPRRHPFYLRSHESLKGYTKTSIWQKLRTFVMVSALALLVWVWADLAMTDEHPSGPLELIVKLPPGLTVLEPDGTIYVQFKLSGPKREIDWLRDDLDAKENPWRPEVVIAERKTGRREIDLKVDLSRRDIESRGLKIEDIRPAKITVDIGEWITITRPVKPNIDETRLAPESLSTTPQSVQIRVLRRYKELIETMNLRTEHISLLGVAEGAAHTKKPAILQTLDHPTAGEITFKLVDKKAVNVRFTVMPTADLSTETLANIPVGVAGPPEVLDQYKVVFGDQNEAVLRQLKIKGKADAIKTLKEKRPEMLAYIILTQEDAKRTQQGQTLSPHKVQFDLPDGVEIDEHPLDLTSITLKKREPR